MKMKFAASCIVIATALAPIVALGADQGSGLKQPVTFVKDSELAARIKARLAQEKFSSLPNITIETDAKGAVKLSGRVTSEKEADNIIFIVHRIEGVTAVRSYFAIPGDKVK